MAIFKCKMCGGSLNVNENESYTTCEYCGTKQTLPKLDNDERANLYDRANHFRRNNEYDKATPYAERQGTYIQLDNGNSWWWLRSFVKEYDYVSYIDTYGTINGHGVIYR